MREIIGRIGRRVGAALGRATVPDASRAAARDAFLRRAGWAGAAITPLAGDASARRYDRLSHPRLGPAMLMDAPPEAGGDAAPFAAATGALRGRGFSAPDIYASDLRAGFVLLEDLGDDLYARVAADRPELETPLYTAAAEVLAALHAAAPPARLVGFGADLPLAPYDGAALKAEARLILDWWIPAVSGAAPSAEAESAFAAACDALIAPIKDDRSAIVLRDFHAENLIWLPERADIRRVGLLDYQDALAGHPAYDLVSLIEDARRDVSEEAAAATIAAYASARGHDHDALAAACAALGAQRNAKIVGIFTRLALRDRKPRYLALIPRVWAHLRKNAAHPAAAAFGDWLDAYAPEPTPERLTAVAARVDAQSEPPVIDTAMTLAAGLGTRMRPLTDTRPKPLLDCGGATLLDRTLDRAREIGVKRGVVNAHYLAGQIEAHLRSRQDLDLQFSHEVGAPLETGGGVRAALRALDRDLFLVANSDNVWTGRAAFEPLVAAWRSDEMDALLLLVPVERAVGYRRMGDFFLGPRGRLIRRGAATQAPMVYTGAQLITRRAFEGAPRGAFSMNLIWDRLIGEGRAFGVAHGAEWADVGTPEGLAEAALLLERRDGRKR